MCAPSPWPLVFISEKDDWNCILASLGLLLTGAYTSGASEAPKEPALGDPLFLPAACLPDPWTHYVALGPADFCVHSMVLRQKQYLRAVGILCISLFSSVHATQ